MVFDYVPISCIVELAHLYLQKVYKIDTLRLNMKQANKNYNSIVFILFCFVDATTALKSGAVAVSTN